MTVGRVGGDRIVVNPSLTPECAVSDEQINRILVQLAKIEQKLETVEELARETNGRVTRLEAFRHRLEGSRATIRVVEPVIAGIVVAAAALAMNHWG